MTDRPRPSRRSFVLRVAGAAAFSSGALALVAGSPARSQPTRWTGFYDRDPVDPHGHGDPTWGTRVGTPDPNANRTTPTPTGAYTGYNDRDPTDRHGYGRPTGAPATRVRCSDTDSGNGADRAYQGVRCTQ